MKCSLSTLSLSLSALLLVVGFCLDSFFALTQYKCHRCFANVVLVSSSLLLSCCTAYNREHKHLSESSDLDQLPFQLGRSLMLTCHGYFSESPQLGLCTIHNLYADFMSLNFVFPPFPPFSFLTYFSEWCFR